MPNKFATIFALTLALTQAPLAQAQKKSVYLTTATSPLPLFTAAPPQAASGETNKHYQLGISFKKAGDANRALIEFLQAAKECPRCTKAFYEQALLFRQKGYAKLAESALNQALQIEPNFKDARVLLAAIRLEGGNAGGAAKELSLSLGLSELKGEKVKPVKTEPAESTVVTAVKPRAQSNGEDAWTTRLRYLNDNGTNSLKSGEAFMYSEDTGEAVLMLANGERIRRKIANPRNGEELVQERRPELLIPSEYSYKLSTQGKVVAEEPARPQDAVSDKGSLAFQKPEVESTEVDIADNKFTREPFAQEPSEPKKVADIASETKPAVKTDAERAPEESALSNISQSLGTSVEVVVEKTQKFLGWVKRTLHL